MKSRPAKSRHPIAGETAERLSISISKVDKSGLERIAADKRVSLAWVIRDAVTRYLEEESAKSERKTQGDAR